LHYRAGENVSDFAFCATVWILFIYLSTTILDENETYNSIYITEVWFRFKTSAPEVCGEKVTLRQVSLRPLLSSSVSVMIVKGKAIPLQAWTGPEGSRRLRLPDFKTIGT
jgi:hypothetical protein